MTCAPSEDSDQPGHLISLGIRPVWSVFAVHMKKHWVYSYPLRAQRRLWSDWADAQADLSLRWAQMSFCGFYHAMAQICFSVEGVIGKNQIATSISSLYNTKPSSTAPVTCQPDPHRVWDSGSLTGTVGLKCHVLTSSCPQYYETERLLIPCPNPSISAGLLP